MREIIVYCVLDIVGCVGLYKTEGEKMIESLCEYSNIRISALSNSSENP